MATPGQALPRPASPVEPSAARLALVRFTGLVRENSHGIGFWAVFVVQVGASTMVLTVFLAEVIDAGLPVTRTGAFVISSAVTVVFWVGMWARLTRHGRARDLGVATTTSIMGGWLVGSAVRPGMVELPAPTMSLAIAMSVIGCTFAGCVIAISQIEGTRTGAPTGHALYRFYDERGRLLYIGITGDVRARFRQHADSKAWWKQVAVREIVHCRTRADLLAAEREAIIRERPRYNVIHNGRRR